MIEYFERKTVKQEFLNSLIKNRTEKYVNDNKGTDSDFEDSIRYKSYMDGFIDGLKESVKILERNIKLKIKN